MGKALNKHAVEIQEFIFQPVQFNAKMRAAVQIQIDTVIALYRKIAVVINLEALGGTFGDFVDMTKGCRGQSGTITFQEV